MKKVILMLLSAAFTVLTGGCKKNIPVGSDDPDVDFGNEIEWDGEKRGDVFYEIFVRSFADSNGDGIGDLDGVTAKLDYLDELGVSGIWLMPVNPSPSYHGYDVTDYTAINPQYGTLTDFDDMITKAHSLGIKVILDFVINHTSAQHPWFEEACSTTDNRYRDYFLFSQSPQSDIRAGLIPMTDWYDAGQWHSVRQGTTGYSYMGMFSSLMPDLNYHEVDDVENSPAYLAICAAGKFWLDRGADGFRLDAVKHIYQSETSDENPRFLKKFYDEMRKTESNVYMIGEVLSESNLVAPYYAGLPALFDFSSWWRLSWALNNDVGKWYPKDLLEYEAMFAAVRPDYIHATKLSNHDEDRTGSVVGGNIDKMKMAAKILLTASGSPYIYYGEEIGMLGTKAGGDENVRDPFLWSVAGNDSWRTKWHNSTFSTDATVRNLAVQRGDPNSLWNVYRQFMLLRNADPVMAYGKMVLPDGFDDADQTDKQVMAFYREYQGTRYIVIHNLSAIPSTYIINSAVERGVWQHGGASIIRYGPTRYSATLPPYSSVICEL